MQKQAYILIEAINFIEYDNFSDGQNLEFKERYWDIYLKTMKTVYNHVFKNGSTVHYFKYKELIPIDNTINVCLYDIIFKIYLYMGSEIKEVCNCGYLSVTRFEILNKRYLDKHIISVLNDLKKRIDCKETVDNAFYSEKEIDDNKIRFESIYKRHRLQIEEKKQSGSNMKI